MIKIEDNGNFECTGTGVELIAQFTAAIVDLAQKFAKASKVLSAQKCLDEILTMIVTGANQFIDKDIK